MRTVQPGQVIAGKYVVQGIIGRGGVGIIAAARHVTLRQLVALKFLRPEIATDPEVMRRFVREAQAAAQIRSEHVARVMDAGMLDDGTVFLVFEHLTGRDLARVLREDGPLSIPDAVDYITQACEAVAEAHALGIVHRDLKPANLFLTRAPDGAPFVKVLDFGLSKLSQPALTVLTAENLVIGSPHFMSPEQMRSSRDADARSDIWALGIVLFGLLTGRVPFEGHFLTEVCAAILGGKPLLLRELRTDAPPELEAVILGCLRLKPEDRIQSVAEFAAALRPFTPEHGQGRAARIALVAESAKRSLSTNSTSGGAPSPLEAVTLERSSPSKQSLDAVDVARQASGHGPSPASLAPVGASTDPPARAARSHRGTLLAATAVLSLSIGTFSTVWFARDERQPSLASATPRAVVIAPSASASALATSINALRPAPEAPPSAAVPRAASARTPRAATPARIAAPRLVASSKPARPLLDEELILNLPH